MDFKDFLAKENEKPLDNLVSDGGFCKIFRTVGCIGDSLASGEMESQDEDGNIGYHDYYEYSWGQFMARDCGFRALNFSRGGMTAEEYCESFAAQFDFWSMDKRCQAYIIALGANDVRINGCNLGSISDIDQNNWHNNKKSFLGYYAQIIQRLKEIQPKAKFFLVTLPNCVQHDEERNRACDLHQKLLYELADIFDNTYLIDLRKYAPDYDEPFRQNFHLGGHLNTAGYLLTAKMFESYIDYIIRHNMEDFSQVAFIGKPVHNCTVKW